MNDIQIKSNLNNRNQTNVMVDLDTEQHVILFAFAQGLLRIQRNGDISRNGLKTTENVQSEFFNRERERARAREKDSNQ